MALKSDDYDIRPALLNVELGGNGDYYITIVEKKDQYDEAGNLEYDSNVLSSVRIAMSGGNSPHDVKMAVGYLFQALEKYDLNVHPYHEETR